MNGSFHAVTKPEHFVGFDQAVLPRTPDQGILVDMVLSTYSSYTYGSTNIPYLLIRAAGAKAVKITVELEHGVEVTIPAELDEAQINAVLRKKAPWILEKLHALEQIALPTSPKEFISGEKFSLLGYAHMLVLEERAERKPFVVMRGGQLIVTVMPGLTLWDRRALVRDTLQRWYMRQAEQKLPQQIALYATKLNVYPEKVVVRDLDKRWGSCTPRGTITLNWRLVMAPIQIVDYIAVHELCHLRVPNHSPEFWGLMRMVLPDYEERREWLRLNGPTFTL